MNKDQVKGSVKDLAGKVQESVGRLIGSKRQEIRGIQRQVAGKAEKHLGDIKEALGRAGSALKSAAKPG